jgi:hypothetical protein
MRKPGIEPGARQWECRILPLNHMRICHVRTVSVGQLFNFFVWEVINGLEFGFYAAGRIEWEHCTKKKGNEGNLPHALSVSRGLRN